MVEKKTKIYGVLAFLIVGILSLANISMAYTGSHVTNDNDNNSPDLPLDVFHVWIDGVGDVENFDNSSIDLERGQELVIQARVLSAQDIEGVEVSAFISGYEHSSSSKLSDTVGPFDVQSNVRYTKTLKLQLPDNMDSDADGSYNLRILISDKSSLLKSYNYRILVSSLRHKVEIKDVIVTPSVVETGRTVIVKARIKNYGQKTEDDVKLTVRIPELGLVANEYFDNIDAGESDTSQEIYLRIPQCAAPGLYTLKATIDYQDGDESATTTSTVQVVDTGSCAIKPTPTEPTPEGKTIINIGNTFQNVQQGQGGAVYPITITNTGQNAVTYIITVDGAESFATTSISPSNLMTVNGGETKAIYVYLSATETAPEGQKMFSVTIKSGSTVVQQIPLTANVIKTEKSATGGWSTIKRDLQVALIVLVVLLVILGLVLAFGKLRGREESGEETQTYY